MVGSHFLGSLGVCPVKAMRRLVTDGGPLARGAAAVQAVWRQAARLAGFIAPVAVVLLGLVILTAIGAGSHLPWYFFALLWGLPLLFLLGVLAVSHRRRPAQEAAQELPAGGAAPQAAQPMLPSLPRDFQAIQPEESLADVVGHDEAKRELADLIALLHQEAKLLRKPGPYPRGVLLIGLPGTGRTMLARAVAGEAGAHFLKIDVPELLELYREGGDLLHRLFQAAQQLAPTIVFLDGIEVLKATRPERDGAVEQYADRRWFLRELLTEMGNLPPQAAVLLLASVTNPRHVNPVLLRPGRFERQVGLSLPTWSQRLEVLERQLQRVPPGEDVDLQGIARQTVGLSWADLTALAQRAIWHAQREGRLAVGQDDLLEALNQVVLSGEFSGQLLGAPEQRIAAFHEAGHALLSCLLSEFPPLGSLSILPGNDWSAQNEYRLAVPPRLVTKTTLLSRLTVVLGGRSAEEIALGDVSIASESDLEQATRLARRMTARWGMSELGPISFPIVETAGEYAPELTDAYQCSEASASQIDRAVRVLLEDRHAVARHILKTNRPLLDHLANLLLREETIRGEPLARLMERISSAASLEEPRTKRSG